MGGGSQEGEYERACLWVLSARTESTIALTARKSLILTRLLCATPQRFCAVTLRGLRDAVTAYRSAKNAAPPSASPVFLSARFRGPRRNPAQRVRWGEEPQRRKRVLALARERAFHSLRRRCRCSWPLSASALSRFVYAQRAASLRLGLVSVRCAALRSPSLRSIRAAHRASALLRCHASAAHNAVLSRSDCTSRPAALPGLRSVCSAPRLSPLCAAAQRVCVVTLRLCATRGFPPTRAGLRGAPHPCARPRSGPGSPARLSLRFCVVTLRLRTTRF